MIAREKKLLIRDALKSLIASYHAIIAQKEAISLLSNTLEHFEEFVVPEEPHPSQSSTTLKTELPLVDRSTLTIAWNGKSCFLGNTLMFWFFDRLLQSVNQYVSHVDLLDDVWGGHRQGATIRGVVKRLRDRLAESDLQELADAIDGTSSGYYGLILV